MVVPKDSKSTTARGIRRKFTASRGPVELCSGYEKFPLDVGVKFIDVPLW